MLVLIVQSFEKIAPLHALAPKGTEPITNVAKLVALILFVVLGVGGDSAGAVCAGVGSGFAGLAGDYAQVRHAADDGGLDGAFAVGRCGADDEVAEESVIIGVPASG